MIADSLAVAGRETLYGHPGTGAVTELVEIVRRDRLEPLTAEAALEIADRDPGPDGKPQQVFNARSKRAAVTIPAPSRMFDDGGVQERVRLIRPATRETMARAELDASNWRPARRDRVAPALGCRDRRPAVAPGIPLLARLRPAAAGLGPPAGREHARPAPHLG